MVFVWCAPFRRDREDFVQTSFSSSLHFLLESALFFLREEQNRGGDERGLSCCRGGVFYFCNSTFFPFSLDGIFREAFFSLFFLSARHRDWSRNASCLSCGDFL